MRRVLKKATDIALGILMLPMVGIMSLMAQTTATPPPQTFSTTIYLDYRYFLSNAGPMTLEPTIPAVAYLNNQFIFRRAYFTYENKINDNLKFRFRFDADNTANVTGISLIGNPVTGTSLKKDDKLRPFIKHLYLQYDNFLVPKMTLNVGMIETLTFKPAEERWGYRSVAKTLMDGYKDITGVEINASSADIGATLKYSFAKYFRLGAGYYNGSGYSHAENNQYKEVELQAQLSPIAGISFVGYVDMERQLPVVALPAETKPQAATYKVDAFFEMVKNLVLAGEWFTYQNDLYQAAGEKFDVGGWSVFGRYTVKPDKFALFARYDSYMPNSLVRDRDMTLAIVGFDWAPYHASMKLQPNVWFVNYKNGVLYNINATSNSDVMFNLTFFLSF
jgi:hypothetical protein